MINHVAFPTCDSVGRITSKLILNLICHVKRFAKGKKSRLFDEMNKTEDSSKIKETPLCICPQ